MDTRGDRRVPAVVGRWNLLAWRSLGDDGAITGQPFGEHPHGARGRTMTNRRVSTPPWFIPSAGD
jgi:hypothetical protein